jgi:hypothetical protein
VLFRRVRTKNLSRHEAVRSAFVPALPLLEKFRSVQGNTWQTPMQLAIPFLLSTLDLALPEELFRHSTVLMFSSLHFLIAKCRKSGNETKADHSHLFRAKTLQACNHVLVALSRRGLLPRAGKRTRHSCAQHREGRPPTIPPLSCLTRKSRIPSRKGLRSIHIV